MNNSIHNRTPKDNYSKVLAAHKRMLNSQDVDEEMGKGTSSFYHARTQMSAFPHAGKMDKFTDAQNRLAVILAQSLKTNLEKVKLLVKWLVDKVGEPGIYLLADQWPGFTANNVTEMYYKCVRHLAKIPDPVTANDPNAAPGGAPTAPQATPDPDEYIDPAVAVAAEKDEEDEEKPWYQQPLW